LTTITTRLRKRRDDLHVPMREVIQSPTHMEQGTEENPPTL